LEQLRDAEVVRKVRHQGPPLLCHPIKRYIYVYDGPEHPPATLRPSIWRCMQLPALYRLIDEADAQSAFFRAISKTLTYRKRRSLFPAPLSDVFLPRVNPLARRPQRWCIRLNRELGGNGGSRRTMAGTGRTRVAMYCESIWFLRLLIDV